MPYDQILNQILWIFFLGLYTISVFFLTKKIYDYMIKKHFKKSVAVYYNRKLIHILAGGVICLIVPFVFDSPWFPLLAGVFLAFVTFLAHRIGNAFYWFQTEGNINDVSFCLMWGVAIFILWQIFDNPYIAIIPAAFIAFGDGITGIVRNIAFQERKKHPIGNVYMMGVCIPIGYFFANMGNPSIPIWGIIAAVVGSLFERYEFGIIDDNVLVAGSAVIILYIGGILGPFG